MKPTSCVAPWRPSAMSAPSTNSRKTGLDLIARGYPEGVRQKLFQPDQGFWRIRLSAKAMRRPSRSSSTSPPGLKHFHPDAFCCGLLNAQPMGFYAPAQIVGDARKNGVTVCQVDVCFSHGDNTLEEKCGDHHAVRLGFRQIDGFRWVDPDEEQSKLSSPECVLECSSIELVEPQFRISLSPAGRGRFGLQIG